MFRQNKTMTVVIRLALTLFFFGNVSLVSSLIGSPRKIDNGPVQGQGPARTASYWANPKPSTMALAERVAPTTESSIPGAVRVKVVFPPRREQFRNLTRAVEYRIVHDDNEDDGDNEDGKEATTRKRDPYESLRRIREKEKSLFPSSNDDGSIQPGTWQWWLLMAILRPLALWFWFAETTKRLLGILRLRRPPPTKGFSGNHVGGTKRHYALLVAASVSGATGQTAAVLPIDDPLAYHRAAVHSAHQRTVADLPTESLSLVGNGIRISAVQGSLLKWALRNNKRRKRNQQG